MHTHDIKSRICRLEARIKDSVCPSTIAFLVKSMTSELDPEATPCSVTHTVETTQDRPSGIRLRTIPEPAEPVLEPRPLRASQILAVARQEIAWFHTSDGVDEESAQARVRIGAWLGTLDGAAQQVLALRYESMPWPESLAGKWDDGFALALSLAATDWRPTGHRRYALEQIATSQLEEAAHRHGLRVLRGVARRANWDFNTALRAYAHARGRSPSVLP